MKIDLTKDEIWALMGTIEGVWESEWSDLQRAAYEKLYRAHDRAAIARNALQGDGLAPSQPNEGTEKP